MSINRYICIHIHTYSGMLPLPIRMGNEGSYRMRTRLSRKEICLVVTAQSMYTWWAGDETTQKENKLSLRLVFPKILIWIDPPASKQLTRLQWRSNNFDHMKMHFAQSHVHQIENPMKIPSKTCPKTCCQNGYTMLNSPHIFLFGNFAIVVDIKGLESRP